ncbi:MAG TPA: hypothetical protein PKD16_04085 [Saprospiraceae bacterium]|jgi:Ca2+/Na+ antiporter|nr:hypothetical protein [Saprospiraceae bacterium]MBK8885492.1 hypothetical protein [Saprospiraceae bacterium]HMT52387.1 hypothetical protein [Saprospiraceae bacterium]HMT69313.1 hypothetical protein [Saprospiraceae bacterium]
MADDMTPYIRENKSQKIQDIVTETENAFQHEGNITLGESKRIELIRKMKQDTDKREYMMMFNALMIGLTIISTAHFVVFGSIFALVSILLCLVYFVYIRKRLTMATLNLTEHKNNFDRYLWEGFYLKEMRYSAVKLAYFIFFPLLLVFTTDLISDERITFWLGILIAAAISSIGWLIFFSDDKNVLESIESELKSLEFLG